MKNILLINQSNTDNIGDQAILYTMSKIIKRHDFNVISAGFVDVSDSGKVKKSSRMYLGTHFIKKYASFFKKYIKRLLWLKNQSYSIDKILRANEFEHIIIGGGQLLLSNDIFPLALYCWTSKAKKLQPNAKIHLYSVGVGEKFTLDEMYLINTSTRYIDSFFVRDDFSKEMLKKITNLDSDNINVVPDVVYSISNYYQNRGHQNTSVYFPIKYEVLDRYNLMNISQDTYYSRLEEQIIDDYNKGFEVVLSYSSNEDYEIVQNLQKYVFEKNNIEFNIVDLNTVEDLVNLISSAKKITSARMHPLIIASSYEVDVNPIIISEKLSSFEKIVKEDSFNISGLKIEIEESLTELLQSK